MASIKEMMQEVVNLDHDDRIKLGKSALKDIITILENNGVKDDEKQLIFVLSLIKLFVSADKKCSKAELDLVNSILNSTLTYDEFYEMTNNGADPEFINELDDVVDSLTQEEKGAIVLFGLCIIAADEKITVEEQQIFMKILN